METGLGRAARGGAHPGLSRRRRPLAGLTATAGAAAIVLVATLADAGRPLDTEDTTVLDPGAAELEAGLELSRGDDGRTLGGRLVAAVGVFPGLEARIEASVLASDPRGQSWRAGAGDSLIGFKYRLLADSSHAPAVLLAAAVRLPTGDDTRGLGEGTPAVVALAAVSRRWGPLTLTANAGYVFEAGGRADDAVLAGLAGSPSTGPSWAKSSRYSVSGTQRTRSSPGSAPPGNSGGIFGSTARWGPASVPATRISCSRWGRHSDSECGSGAQWLIDIILLIGS